MSKIGIDLNRFILEEERQFPQATGSLSLALMSIENATKIISSRIRKAGLSDILGKLGKINIQGEEVQKLDQLSNNWLIEHLSDSGEFYALASEEVDDAIFPEKGKDGKYVIALDPLDGSSNIDVNVNVGTIFSIYKKYCEGVENFFQEGYKQVAAGYVVYGSSTMMMYTTKNGTHGFTLDPSVGSYLLSHPNLKMPSRGKIYSINEGYSQRWDDSLRKYIENIKSNNYSARYIGSMVADVHRTLLKGGIFAYPGDKKNPCGKLRLLYEAAPMSLLIEQAGGRATDGNVEILSIKAGSLHQRTPVFMGSKEDIDDLMGYIKLP